MSWCYGGGLWKSRLDDEVLGNYGQVPEKITALGARVSLVQPPTLSTVL